MFQEEYRKAYDKINLEPAKLQELFSLTEQKIRKENGNILICSARWQFCHCLCACFA